MEQRSATLVHSFMSNKACTATHRRCPHFDIYQRQAKTRYLIPMRHELRDVGAPGTSSQTNNLQNIQCHSFHTRFYIRVTFS